MYKGYKSRAFLTRQDGGKCAYAESPARLAVEKNSWNVGCRLPKIKAKAGVEDARPQCNNDKKKVPGCFSYLQNDISRYVSFWEQAQLNRKISVPLSYFVELFHNQPLYGLCYGCDRKLQKQCGDDWKDLGSILIMVIQKKRLNNWIVAQHEAFHITRASSSFHHEKPVRTGGGYTYFRKETHARTACRCPEGSLETDGIPKDDLSSLTLPIKRLLSLAAETDLLQHMKRLVSCTMVYKTQDKLSLELLKEFLEYGCGLKLQQECISDGPNVRRIVEDVPWRSLTDPFQPFNQQHIQPAENATLLLKLCRNCQLKGVDPKTVMEFLMNSLLNSWPDGEKVTLETSIKEQPIDDGWFVSQRILLPKPFQNNVDEDNKRFEQSSFKDLKKTEERDGKKKEDKLMTVFNSIMILPKLLREEEEKMLLQSLKNMSRTQRIVYLRQHGFLKDNLRSPFIPGLSERPRGLWTAPKAFTVHHKKIFTRPMSPFSNDRVYDIRSLKANFQVQKSEKELTQFIKVQLSQMPSESSPSPKMKIAEDSRREQQASIQPIFLPHHENVGGTTHQQEWEEKVEVAATAMCPRPGTSLKDEEEAVEVELAALMHSQSFVPVVEPPENQEAKNSDVRSDTWHGRKGSSVRRNSSQAKKTEGRKPSRLDTDSEVNQTPEKMSRLQELYPASPSKFKSGSEDDNQMRRDLSEETTLLPTVSLQSTAHYEQQPNITKYHSKGHSYDLSSCGLKTMQTGQSGNTSDTKKEKGSFNSFDPMENNMLHQREPDSLVHLVTSTEKTKSHSLELVMSIPDGLEGYKNEWQQDSGKPPDTGDDRQTSEKAAEAIVTRKEERERLPRAVFTRRKPLPSIRRGTQRNSQKTRVVMEETQRRRPSTLDFLTKYCIINPGRLSFYERIFLKYCNHEDVEETRDQEPTDTSNTNLNCIPGGFDHIEEILIQKKAKGNVDIGRKIQQILDSGSVSDQLEKTQFKIKKLLERKKYILSTVQELQDQRMVLQATLAKQQAHTDEQMKKKKRKGKKEAKLVLNMEEKEENTYEIPSSLLSSVPSSAPTKQADEYTKPECLDVKLKLLWKKHEDITSRLSELCETRQILEQKNREASLQAIDQNSKVPPEKRRLQSALFCRLHPNKDLSLDLNDLQEALQDVNKCLVSPKEFSYIFHILELPGQYRLNLELFCIVAALSEKVTQLDPVIKKLINKLDFEALSIRIEKAKELWHLLQENEGEKERKTNRRSQGSVSIRSLALELAAGGYSLEAINFALQKFDRTEAGVLSFLDFVTYIPLFVEIHEGIVQNPFSIIPITIPNLEDDLDTTVNQSTEQVP